MTGVRFSEVFRLPPAYIIATMIIFSVSVAVFSHKVFAQVNYIPNDSYHDRKFDISMVGCVSRPIAICTIEVTAKVRTFWDNSIENSLIDLSGVPIPAASISVGGSEVTLPAHAGQYWSRLEAGIPTKIDIKFDRIVAQNNFKYIIIYVGHWSAKTIKLRINWMG
jgi:hypothetical protein